MKKVYQLLKKVPKGKVTTYKELGKAAKIHPRTVGILMRKNPYAPQVPCHRVVCSDGRIAGFSGKISKASMLKSEGIKIKNGKIVDFEKKLFIF